MVDYDVVDIDDVAVTDLSGVDSVPPDLNIKPVGDVLGLSDMRCTVWYFEPGEEIQYHAHAHQEEMYFIFEGEFSLKLGESGDEEYLDASAGSFWVAKPKIGHGHRYIGEEQGVVLSFGAPSVADPGLDPHSLADE
jgi:quercetin dioxygenase-like cupin family protein